MNVFTDASSPDVPAVALSLAAMLAQQPEVTTVGIGAGYSCLTSWGSYIVTPEAATPSTTEELDLALDAIVQRWVRDMTIIGMAPLVMTVNFEKGPVEKAEITRADATALFEALAAPMYAGGLDPTWPTCIVSLARAQPDGSIEIESVATAPRCDELTRARLISAAKVWLVPRRSFFKSIRQLHLEVNASCWEAPGGPLDIPEAAELDLLGMPAAGTA